MPKKIVDPVDTHVGARVRMRRVLIGMSQEKLGAALGITFQQIQKYEKGTNRIGSSRMQQISTVLGMPVEYFFEDAPGSAKAGQIKSDAIVEFLSTTEGLQLNKAFTRISDPKIRRKFLELVQAFADSEEGTALKQESKTRGTPRDLPAEAPQRI